MELAAGAHRTRWLGLVALTLGVAMIIVDATIVNVAIPSIIQDLGIGYTQAEWANAIYSLVFAALLISSGRLGDKLGRKRLYLIGLVVFVIASMLAGVAQSGQQLLGARFLQGVGGALILPSTLSIVNATFRGREREIAFGIWGSVIGGMAALGPLIGGWATTELSWRWAFFINVPVGVIAFAGAWLFVRESRDPAGGRGFDLPGTATLSGGLALLVFGLIEGQNYGWVSPKRTFAIGQLSWPFDSISPILCALVASAVLLSAFIAIERRRTRAGRQVLVDFSLFVIPSFRYGNITVSIVSLGEFGLIFVIPLFLQSVLAYSALETGVALLGLAGGAFLAAPFAAKLSQRYGGRLVVRVGMALEVVGTAGLGLVFAPGMPWWHLEPFLFLYGFGIGLATAQLTSVILLDVPMAQSGEASGIQSTSRQVGSALGIAILGGALAILFSHHARSGLDDVAGLAAGQRAAIVQAVDEHGGPAITGVRAISGSEPLVAKLDDAFASAASSVAFIASGFIALGLLSSLLLPRSRSPENAEP
jgi:EmrB/QacA subfamily drug resistance transporter